MGKTVRPKPSSIEYAERELPPLQEMTPEENRAALEQARLLLYYVYLNLAQVSKPGSIGATLSYLIMTYLDGMRPLAALAVLAGKELPTL